MKKNISGRAAKLILTLFAASIVFATQAQEFGMEKKDHIGLTGSFGMRSGTLHSNLSAIDNMNLVNEGGSLGVLWGNKAFEAKLAVGYYYSNIQVAHTTDVLLAEFSSNFYPIRAITKRAVKVEPYLIGAIAKNYHKLHGYYVGDQSGPINYSVSLEPYLGYLDVYNASVGIGVEVSLLDDYDFVKIFADAKYSNPFTTRSSSAFTQTTVSNQVSFNLGISFGTNHFSGK